MNISCAIGITLLLSSVFMNLNKDDILFKKFNDSLSERQRKIYTYIVRERLMIYTIGLIIGTSVGIYYLYTFKNDKYRLCKFLAIVYILQMGIYYIYPKHPLMLNYLTSKKQVEGWAKIYTHMKNNWIKSLSLGFIGYLVLSNMV
tara:strand:- start:138 stop:572 length:435 start_codon:yes stop_codon:yes gene_type:complete